MLGLIFLPLLIWLGLWQLERAEEKQALLEAFESQQAEQPLLLNAEPAEKIQAIASYTKVKLDDASMDDESYWLLDNRMQGGRFGYELLQIANINGLRLLINRGWLAGPIDRRLKPDMRLLQGRANLLGQLVTPSKNAILNETFYDPIMPQRIVQIDLAQLSQLYGQPIHGLVRLDAESEGALYINWPTVNISPSKHRGYALQWFSMATALVILLVFANSNLLAVIKSPNSHNNKM